MQVVAGPGPGEDSSEDDVDFEMMLPGMMGHSPLDEHILPGCPVDGIEEEMGTNPAHNVSTVTALFSRSDSTLARVWVAKSVYFWCEISAQSKTYKREIRTQGLLKRLVHALAHANASSQDLGHLLLQVLSRCICDERQSALQAVKEGLFHILARGLQNDLKNGDLLCLARVTLCNSVVSTTSLITSFLDESGIVPVLVQSAGEESPTLDARVRQISLACLANLSNYEDAVDVLVRSGALEMLAKGLHEYPVQDMNDKRIMPQWPSVSYMQALAAVVKIVGRGAYVGGVRGEHEGEDSIFRICGSTSTMQFDPTRVKDLVLDRRSVVWMLSYLRASIEDVPYPPTSNIFGRPWKVSLSLACIAKGSADNRRLLHEIGVWLLLFRAVRIDVDHMGGLVVADDEEEAMTRAHAIQAMRKMLRSPADVQESIYYLGFPEARHALRVIKRVARGQCQHNASNWKVRAAAAELILIWGLGWDVERLLWLAVLKPVSPAAPQDDADKGAEGAEAGVTTAEATTPPRWGVLRWFQAEFRRHKATKPGGRPEARRPSGFRLLLPTNIFQIMRHVVYLGGEGDLPPAPFPAMFTPADLGRCHDCVAVAVLDSLFSHQEEARVAALPPAQRSEDLRQGFLEAEPRVQVERLTQLWEATGPLRLKVEANPDDILFAPATCGNAHLHA